jgi:hypothetical protein
LSLPLVGRVGLPRLLMIAGLPLIAFAITIAFTLAQDAGEDDTPEPAPTLQASLREDTPTAVPPTQTPVPGPPTPLSDRADCAAIRGTDYRSEAERQWFASNCAPPTSVPAVSQVRAPASTQQRNIGTVYGSADRLVISRVGINAPVNISVVPPDGTMGEPVGANDVVLYDFSAIPGLGGYPGLGGNTVIAGHVDYICCPAVFARLRDLREGDTIDYYTGDGQHFQYVVQWYGDYPPETPWASVVNGGPGIMTLITCNGTFDRGLREYSHRRVVRAQLVQ